MHLSRCFALLLALLLALFAASGILSAQPLGPVSSDTVVAIVDGKNVTVDDVQQMMNLAPPDVLNIFRNDPQAGLQGWYMIQFLGRDAAAMKLDQQQPWKEQIEAATTQILMTARINQEMNAYPVAQDVILDYYKKHPEQFQRRTVSGIFVRFKLDSHTNGTPEEMQELLKQNMLGTPVTRSEAEARTLAADIAKKVRSGGPIAALVAEYSEDTDSKAKQGDLGYVTNTTGPEAFRAPISALAKGGLTDPIRVPGGFWILRVNDVEVSPIDDVSFEIATQMRQEHLGVWMKGVRDKYQPKLLRPDLLVTPPAPGR